MLQLKKYIHWSLALLFVSLTTLYYAYLSILLITKPISSKIMLFSDISSKFIFDYILTIFFVKIFQRLKILNLVTLLAIPIINISLAVLYTYLIDYEFDPMYKISHIIITSISILLMYIFYIHCKDKIIKSD